MGLDHRLIFRNAFACRFSDRHKWQAIEIPRSVPLLHSSENHPVPHTRALQPSPIGLRSHSSDRQGVECLGCSLVAMASCWVLRPIRMQARADDPQIVLGYEHDTVGHMADAMQA